MKIAWTINNTIKDVCPGNPAELYHPSVAMYYTTNVPDDAENGWILEHGQWVAPPAPPPHVPTQDETIAALTAALEAHYDSVAHKKRYDNRLTCALRAGYAGPFQIEGTTFAVWMDTCNEYGYGVMADCLAGTRAIPTAEELIAELPADPW